MSRSIAVFFLGGTISMAGHQDGVVARLGASELIEAVPQLRDLDVTLNGYDFRRMPGACLTFDDIIELVAMAEGTVADGIVVVQGTDTIEETAYLIDLLWSAETPVVMTGAMRNPTLAGHDGPANLLAAVQVAATDAFRGAGCVVVLNDDVHAARYVRKMHSSNPSTFASPNAGPIGHLVEGEPVVVATVPRTTIFARPSIPVHARVAVVAITLNDGAELLAGAADRLDGLVVAGFGVGHVPADLAPVVGELADALPVVLASRSGAGPILRRTYGFAGSESDLARRGLISAGLLDPYKARVLLRVLLAGGANRAAVAAAFAQASGIG